MSVCMYVCSVCVCLSECVVCIMAVMQIAVISGYCDNKMGMELFSHVNIP